MLPALGIAVVVIVGMMGMGMIVSAAHLLAF
jgi:hypothetical protein